MSAVKTNSFSDASKILDKGGVDALFVEGPILSLVLLEDIEIREQVRKDFEDEDHPLSDLVDSIKEHGVMQPVLLRDTSSGYVLVSGERRCRAAKLAGFTLIPAHIQKMTEEEAEEKQFAENVHRKNLTQIEEAQKIRRDLKKLGSIEAVCKKYQKNNSWVSKRLSLLDLPEQAKRLITENITADVEVVNAVRQIEKVDPVKAKVLVDKLQNQRGKVEARVEVKAVKQEVKPTKKGQINKDKTPTWPAPITSANTKGGTGTPATPATPKDRSAEAPSQGESFAAAKTRDAIEGIDPFADHGNTPAPSSVPTATVANHATANPPRTKALAELLTNAYFNVTNGAVSPENEIKALGLETADAAREFLQTYFDAGKQAIRPANDVMRGLRNGQFSTDGHLAFALAAFLEGADRKAKFDLLNIFGLVKD